MAVADKEIADRLAERLRWWIANHECCASEPDTVAVLADYDTLRAPQSKEDADARR